MRARLVTRRPGFALVLSMLLTLALMTLALGLLAAGTRERAVASAMARKAQAERRAEGAAIAALERWSTRAMSDMPVAGEPRPLTGVEAAVTRLDTGLYLVIGEGRVPGPSGAVVRSAGVMVRTLPSPASALPGAITADIGADIRGGRVDGGTGGPGVLAPFVEVAAAATVTGAPPVDRGPAPAPPEPDPLALPLITGIADLRPNVRVVTPEPVVLTGECVPGAGNWGAPDPGHPCHDLLPVVFVDHDLTVAGGVGRGVLVVRGDLRITEGAVLEGVVVVHGHVEIDGATVRGAVRARSVLLVDGTVVRDDRAVSGSLTAPALDRPFRPPTRWWVPGF